MYFGIDLNSKMTRLGRAFGVQQPAAAPLKPAGGGGRRNCLLPSLHTLFQRQLFVCRSSSSVESAPYAGSHCPGGMADTISVTRIN